MDYSQVERIIWAIDELNQTQKELNKLLVKIEEQEKERNKKIEEGFLMIANNMTY